MFENSTLIVSALFTSCKIDTSVVEGSECVGDGQGTNNGPLIERRGFLQRVGGARETMAGTGA